MGRQRKRGHSPAGHGGQSASTVTGNSSSSIALQVKLETQGLTPASRRHCAVLGVYPPSMSKLQPAVDEKTLEKSGNSDDNDDNTEYSCSEFDEESCSEWEQEEEYCTEEESCTVQEVERSSYVPIGKDVIGNAKEICDDGEYVCK